MNIDTAKRLKSGDKVVLTCGLMSTVMTSGIELTDNKMLIEINNKYDGVLDVLNTEIESFD